MSYTLPFVGYTHSNHEFTPKDGNFPFLLPDFRSIIYSFPFPIYYIAEIFLFYDTSMFKFPYFWYIYFFICIPYHANLIK